MLYWISKAAWSLAEPDDILLLCALAGLALFALGRRRLGGALLIAALGMMSLVAAVPVGGWVLERLEQRFPEWRDDGPVDGIVVLGGAINPASYFAYHGSGLNGAVARITEAARLAHTYKSAKLIYSGGPTSGEAATISEGRAARELFAALGVDPSRVSLEPDSRNTFENALFAKRMARPAPGSRWLLVTSAFHMPRAIACFRAVDFPVEAVPVDFRYSGHVQLGSGLAEGLGDLDLAAHELTGLAAYRLLGETHDLLPAP
jgi:uncharacterized SAM-binding protein YcdF (DUF218 family)